MSGSLPSTKDVEDDGKSDLAEPSTNTFEENEIFKSIDGEKSVDEAIQVESMCINCGENGITKLLLTVIPFYKEIILSSFSCPHCAYTDNEIQSAGEIQAQGVQCTLKVKEIYDLNRKVIKSDFASISIPELELDVPASSQKGEVTTVEGILQRIMEGLRQDQGQRKREHPEDFEQIEKFLCKAEKYKQLEYPFTLILRDKSGKSFICPSTNYLPGQSDSSLNITHFNRTLDEDHQLGIYPELSESSQVETVEDSVENGDLNDEILKFAVNCPDCRAPCETKMKIVKIPYFKEVIIMATDCEDCGSKTNEVKSGGGTEEKGRRITLKVENVEDLSRDVLKAETCSIEMPSLELHVGAGTLGGKFTTLEGILTSIKEQIMGSHSTFIGDSDPEMKDKMDAFSAKFDHCLAISEPFVFILDDPAGNSYIQNIQAPDNDPQLEITEYERSFEQNEDLGLNDINTENYTSNREPGDEDDKKVLHNDTS